LPRDVPLDPWGNPYVYTVPGEDGKPYAILSYGKDGRPGGEGDDADITLQ
jgi:general secretion pathway protein G